MERSQLEHIIRAAAGITGAAEFVVIGSQSIHGQISNPPPECVLSIEADIFTFRSPDDAELIDGSIGEASPFHRTFGYYAHGVGEDTAVLPEGWRARLVQFKSLNTGGAAGLCLEVHDLLVSKLVAGRVKDMDYIKAVINRGLADMLTLKNRLATTHLNDLVRTESVRRLASIQST